MQKAIEQAVETTAIWALGTLGVALVIAGCVVLYFAVKKELSEIGLQEPDNVGKAVKSEYLEKSTHLN